MACVFMQPAPTLAVVQGMNKVPSHSVPSQAQSPYRSSEPAVEEDVLPLPLNPSIFSEVFTFFSVLSLIAAAMVFGTFLLAVIAWVFYLVLHTS
jgi:hypothetical protein